MSASETLAGPGRGGGEGVRIRDHLANVRTFLAWLRSGLVLLALGYALTKFDVVERHGTRYVGVLAAATGWLVILGAGFSFMRQRGAIEASAYVPSTRWNVALTLLAAAGGGATLVYLARG